MSNERRRKKFIDGWAQLSIAVEVVLHSLLLVSLISLILFAPPFVTWMSNYAVADHQAVARDLWAMNVSKWPIFFALAIFIGIVSVLFSHHICGPAYKIQHVLQHLNERNLSELVVLRKWDYLVEVQEELNRHILRIREDLAKLQEHHSKARSLTNDLRAKNSAETLNELEKHLAAISETIQAYRGI